MTIEDNKRLVQQSRRVSPLTIKDGKIVERRPHFDPADSTAQLTAD